MRAECESREERVVVVRLYTYQSHMCASVYASVQRVYVCVCIPYTHIDAVRGIARYAFHFA